MVDNIAFSFVFGVIIEKKIDTLGYRIPVVNHN